MFLDYLTHPVKSSVAGLCENHEDASDGGLAILNVGFGLGIVSEHGE